MARFIVFVFERSELDDWRARFPEHDFTFVAYEAFDSTTLATSARKHPRTRRDLADLHAQAPYTGVLNAKEAFVELASRVAGDLGLPRALDEPVIARDKWRMHDALAKRVPRPRSRCLDVHEPTKDLSYPCVVKPRFGFDSLCAFVVQSATELTKRLPRQQRLIERLGYDAISPNDWIVETYVSGSEHSVETLVWDGEVRSCFVSDKWTPHPAHLVETGEVMPSQLDERAQAEVARTAEKSVQALGIRNGWAHTEVKIGEQGPVVIESAARMGGGYFAALFREVYGLDRERVLVELHLDSDHSLQREPRAVAIARRLQLERSAWVYSLRTPKEKDARAHGFRIDRSIPIGPFGRIVLAPPFGYHHTLMDWIVTAECFEKAARHAADVEAQMSVGRIELPDWLSGRL